MEVEGGEENQSGEDPVEEIRARKVEGVAAQSPGDGGEGGGGGVEEDDQDDGKELAGEDGGGSLGLVARWPGGGVWECCHFDWCLDKKTKHERLRETSDDELRSGKKVTMEGNKLI